MTNFEKIKAMKIDEMVLLLDEHTDCLNCKWDHECISKMCMCKDVIKNWLESEVSE